MKKTTKALIGATGVFAGIGLAMNGFVLTRLSVKMKELLNKEEPNDNLTDLQLQKAKLNEEGDAWLDTQDYEHIVIKNRKKQSIHSYVVKQAEPCNKWIVCVHGYTSSPKGVGSYALHHYARGYNILMPALRGHDVSEQQHISMGWLDRLDVVDWIQYLINTYGRHIQIVLHGVSMGSATVMMTTGENLPFNVKCCIADCGYSSVWDEFKNELKATYHLGAFPTLYSASLVSKVIGGYDFWEASSVKQLKKSKTPTLFIHGEEDVFVPYRMMDLNYNAAACPKEKLSIPDAEHADSHLIHPEIYWPEVFKFIDKYVK